MNEVELLRVLYRQIGRNMPFLHECSLRDTCKIVGVEWGTPLFKRMTQIEDVLYAAMADHRAVADELRKLIDARMSELLRVDAEVSA